MGYVKLFTDEFFNENHADFRYYVTCFSYQNDLLSQWRGYADDGRGAAIGFDLDVLKEAGLNPITPVLICNSDDYSKFETDVGHAVQAGDAVIKLAK